MSGSGTGWRWLFGVVAVVVLQAAACGDSDDEGSGEGSDVTTTSEATDSGQEDGAVTAGQCAEDAPDCEDTEVVDDTGPETSRPQTSDGGGEVDPSTGMTLDGGLSVSEALLSDAAGVTGVIAVRGHLYDEGAGAALCETLTGGGERYICGGPLLPVQGLIIHGGLTYTEVEITMFGEIVSGTLVVDPNIS